jgi:transposase
MDTSTQTVTAKTPLTSKRQRRSITEKRRIVEETLADGASVARVARANGVNANQVFYWRKLYQAGKLGASSVALLPVRVKRESKPRTVAHGGHDSSLARSSATLPAGTIHIEFRQAQVRIEGSADPALLRVLLECLGR